MRTQTTHPLASYRQKKGLGRREFADLAGVSYITIYRLETGAPHAPTMDVLRRIVGATDGEISIDQIMADCPFCHRPMADASGQPLILIL